jgi:DHA2 family multidrug resistance protein
MMRNLGGAVGIAASAAIINTATNRHFLMIASNLTPANGAMVRLVASVEQRRLDHGVAGGLDAHAASLRQLWQLAYREASTMAYADAFRAIMIAFALATLLVPFLRPVAAGPKPQAH